MTKIRLANEEDSATISGFQVAMARETENKELAGALVQAAVEAVFEDESKGFYLVAERGEQVCASLLITFEWSDWRNSNLWYIQSVYVLPEHRGQGIFRALYETVYSMAAENDVMFLRLYVETDNVAAQRVYESLGMKRMPYLMYAARVDDT